MSKVELDGTLYNLSDFCLPKHYQGQLAGVLIPNGMVVDRIEKLAMDIAEAYAGKELHIVCVLKGSRGFFTTLLDHLTKIALYKQHEEKGRRWL